jgi:tetratricopeptide (TPR) repeat protein
LTCPGAVVGTPGYLAPEQARGAAGDPRADVFGLGAILCEILTGGPPFPRAGLLDLLQQAREGDLSDALGRLDRCGADPELVRLARGCLAPEPAGRPADGSAVAARVAEYLAGVQERLRRAEVGQARAEARAEGERSRRRLAVGLAGAVLAVLVLGGAALLLVQRHQGEQAREQARRQQAAESALAQAADLEQQGRWAEALAVLEQARQRLDERDGQVNRDVQRALAEAELVGRLEKVRLRAAARTGRAFARARADREFESEFRSAGLGGPDEPAEAVAERVRASGVRAALVSALDAWAMTTKDRRRRDWAQAVARGADQGDDWGRRLRASWGDPAALKVLAREAPLDRLSPHLLATLADALGNLPDSAALLRKAQRRYPGDFWLAFFLALRLKEEGQPAEAAGFFRAALAARPDTPAVLVHLGSVLKAQKKLDEACECYRRAIALDPKDPLAHNNLGAALMARGQLDEAIACYRKALEIDPRFDRALSNLGVALGNKGRVDEAIACLNKAIEINPKYATAHHNLGTILCHFKRDYGGAIACFRTAIELNPKVAMAHVGLGTSLSGKGQVDEAIACFRKAVEVDPKEARAHFYLGNALLGKGQVDDAIASFRKAIELNPKFALAHSNLGNVLAGKGKVDQAITHYRKAIELDPKSFAAHALLGQALLGKGRCAEARDATARALALLPAKHPWQTPISQQLRECRRLARLEARLPAILGGQEQPASAAESLDLARMCAHKTMHDAAVRFYASAFAAEAKLADDLQAAHRYHAARAAALAAAGKGRDASGLAEAQKAELRKRALTWLKADLAARAKQPAGERAAALRRWLADEALAGVRGEQALRALPEAERAAWGAFWAEVQKHLGGKGGP